MLQLARRHSLNDFYIFESLLSGLWLRCCLLCGDASFVVLRDNQNKANWGKNDDGLTDKLVSECVNDEGLRWSISCRVRCRTDLNHPPATVGGIPACL